MAEVFLQGVFDVAGAGLQEPVLLDPSLQHTVPDGAVGRVLYFRGGNSSGELVLAVLTRAGSPVRYFPIGARAEVNVPLRVPVELAAGDRVEVHVAAPAGVEATVVVDLGIREDARP